MVPVIVLFASLAISALAQTPGCQYSTALAVGQSSAVFSPNYNRNYPANLNCNWRLTTPVGNKILLTCNDFRLPSSTNCAGDRVTINGSGNKYCGNGNFVVQSTANTMDINLTTQTTNGRFFCNATTQADPCNCGRRKTTRIVGGVETLVNEFPEQCYLKDVATNTVLCSCTIIENNYVLTAAHCLTGRTAAQVKVVVGDHDTTVTSDTSYTAQYDAAALIIHEAYDYTTSKNDIGLVRVTKPIAYNEAVGPVCLPWKFTSNTFSSNVVTAAGWGLTEFGGRRSNKLQKVDINTIPNSQCLTTYSQVDSTFICTYTPDKDTCQHDSGSSLYYTDPSNSRLYTIGVVSGGEGCGGSRPSLNIRVTSYLSWIKSKTTGATYCSV